MRAIHGVTVTFGYSWMGDRLGERGGDTSQTTVTKANAGKRKRLPGEEGGAGSRAGPAAELR